MIDGDIEIKKRKLKDYRVYGSGKKRERNSCPDCGSIQLKKRNRTRDYICDSCGWIGEKTTKKMW